MMIPTRKIPIDIDQKVADKVAKATALAEHLGPAGFEYITPPIKLSDKSKPIRNAKFDPIEAAERQLKQVSSGFGLWLKQDLKNLRHAAENFLENQEDATLFIALNTSIHAIKGNAPILGNDAAGMIASPLSDLMERCSDHRKALPILALSVSAIGQAIEQKTPLDDQELLKMVQMLNGLNSQCVARKNAQEVPQSYAAGSANCSGKASGISGSCSDTCSSDSNN